MTGDFKRVWLGCMGCMVWDWGCLFGVWCLVFGVVCFGEWCLVFGFVVESNKERFVL